MRSQPETITSPPGRQAIKQKREQRELFFWTIERGLKVIALVAFTIYAVVTLAEGHLPGAELLRYIF